MFDRSCVNDSFIKPASYFFDDLPKQKKEFFFPSYEVTFNCLETICHIEKRKLQQ
jgi:hypothetical protein